MYTRLLDLSSPLSIRSQVSERLRQLAELERGVLALFPNEQARARAEVRPRVRCALGVDARTQSPLC